MTERDENWVPSDEYVPQGYTPSVHSARSTFAFARAKGDKSRRGMYFDAFDRMIEAVRQEEREKVTQDVADTLAWIEQTLALPMYEHPTELGAAVVETLRTVRKLLRGGMHPDARARITEQS